MNHTYRSDLRPSDDRRTVIPVRREESLFGGWGVKV